MAINEKSLSKGRLRKLNALRNSLGEKIANDAFEKWLKTQKNKTPEVVPDRVAEKLTEILKPLESDKSMNLGRKGYVIKRARGKGAKGFLVSKVGK